jgi:hypothetical protein
MTLASRTESEHTTGSFTASIFATESSTSTGVRASNGSGNGATLAFKASTM